MTDHYSESYNAACRYCREVEDSILSSIREDLASFTEETLSDRLHEEIDGSQAIIYTGRSLCYLFGSRNDNAAEEELGDDVKMGPEQRAYWAIQADVTGRIEWENMRDAVEHDRVAEYLKETAEDEEVCDECRTPDACCNGCLLKRASIAEGAA